MTTAETQTELGQWADINNRELWAVDESIILTFHSKLSGYRGEEGGENVGMYELEERWGRELGTPASGHGCRCCTHQLTVDMAVSTKHAQDQASQNFNMNGGGGGGGALKAPLLKTYL